MSSVIGFFNVYGIDASLLDVRLYECQTPREGEKARFHEATHDDSPCSLSDIDH
jgi:hypothetical protein